MVTQFGDEDTADGLMVTEVRSEGGRPRRWWPGYGAVVDADTARVAALVAGVGYGGCALALLTLLLPVFHAVVAPGPTAAVVAIAVVEAFVVAGDVRGLLADDFRVPPVAKTLAQVLAAVAATGLADWALDANRGNLRFVVVLPVLIAAVLGNATFVSIVYVASLGTLAVVSVHAGTPVRDLPMLLVGFGASSAAGAAMLSQLREAHLRAHHAFGLLVETMEVVLRAGGFADALDRFLPLVAVQTGARRIDAFRGGPDGSVHLGSYPFSPTPWHEPPDDLGADGPGPKGSTAAYRISRDRTVIFSTEVGQRLALVLDTGRPMPWRRVTYAVALRRMADELGLLLEHRAFLDRLETLGRTDALTGLANRRELDERLDHEFAMAQRRGAPLAVAMVDIDHFKVYNDEFGHLAGDRVLVLLARLLRQRARATDLVARYGGEEFCLVLPDTDVPGARLVLDQLAMAARLLPTRRPITISIGLAPAEGHLDARSVLAAADTALYLAKEAGRDRLVVAPPAGRLTRP